MMILSLSFKKINYQIKNFIINDSLLQMNKNSETARSCRHLPNRRKLVKKA